MSVAAEEPSKIVRLDRIQLQHNLANDKCDFVLIEKSILRNRTTIRSCRDLPAPAGLSRSSFNHCRRDLRIISAATGRRTGCECAGRPYTRTPDEPARPVGRLVGGKGRSQSQALLTGKSAVVLALLLRAGGSPGGARARPKVLVGYDARTDAGRIVDEVRDAVSRWPDFADKADVPAAVRHQLAGGLG